MNRGPDGRPAVAPPDPAAEWHHVAEQRRRQLERLQGDRRFVIAARLLGVARRFRGRLARSVDPVRAVSFRLMHSLLAVPQRLTASRRERDLRGRLGALSLPTVPGPDPAALVTAVIVTAAQPHRLEALLTALEWQRVRTIVVDNAGVEEIASVVARHPRAERLALTSPLNFSEANERAIADVRTPWVLLLNDDVLPIDDSWLRRMLVGAEEGTVAVGALLVHARRGWSGGRAVDVTVQHAGIGFELDGPTPVPSHLDRGSTPLPRDERREVVAATAACLLVRTESHRSVGGFHAGFDYGMEDVDLCLRLAAFGRIVVALDAVLLHEEGATRLHGPDGRRVRARRQQRNRTLLIARHGVALRRAVQQGPLIGSRPMRIALLGSQAVGPQVDGPRSIDAVPARFVLDGAVSRHIPVGSAAVVVTDSACLPSGGPPDVPVVAWGDDVLRDGEVGRGGQRVIDVAVVGTTAERERLAKQAPTLPVRTLVHPDQAGRVDVSPGVLHAVLDAPRWSIRIGAPSGRRGANWGDHAVADALRTELRALGIVARVTPRDVWGSGFDATADVTVLLKGRGVAPQSPCQRNVVWVMSHPSEIAPGELDAADLVLAASRLLADWLSQQTTTTVKVLPQATDARRFGQAASGQAGRDPARSSRLLFVGNTRSVPRPAVLGALDAGLPLTLIGSGWERFVDPRAVTRSSVAPEDLPAWYGSAEVVLNDHWDEMRRWGIVSNRVLDALAAGACVLSDDVPGMDTLLDGAVATFADASGLAEQAELLLADPGERERRARCGQAAVLAAHTWQHRAATLVDEVAQLEPRG